jgi:3-dehydroquinate dehydratase-2
MKILIINGPNLQLLGKRKPEVYGSATLKDMETLINKTASELGFDCEFFQSCVEGEIVKKIGTASLTGVNAIVINPAAYTHTSVAIRDALEAVGLPAIEVHISNIHKREDFRKISLSAPVCAGQICGFGIRGYEWAFRELACVLKNQAPQKTVLKKIKNQGDKHNENRRNQRDCRTDV